MIVLLLAASSWAAEFRIEEADGKRLHVYDGNQHVLTYNFGLMLKPGVREDRARCCYVHPLYAPDGTLLTDDFPADHLHHRGLSWMWPTVDVDGERFNLWEIRGIRNRFEKWLKREAVAATARIAVENGWYTAKRKVARETVELVVHHATPKGRPIDVTLTFEALESALSITGELPTKKGYGGLGFRFAPRKDTVITTAAGVQEKDSNLLPFLWADLTGTFEGGRRAGATVIIDEKNPGYPNGWTLRNYGYLGVAWPGLQLFTLSPGKPLVLRYRVLLHAGSPVP